MATGLALPAARRQTAFAARRRGASLAAGAARRARRLRAEGFFERGSPNSDSISDKARLSSALPGSAAATKLTELATRAPRRRFLLG
jgi:hypothetical protein